MATFIILEVADQWFIVVLRCSKRRTNIRVLSVVCLKHVFVHCVFVLETLVEDRLVLTWTILLNLSLYYFYFL